jgi:hypothetical protein
MDGCVSSPKYDSRGDTARAVPEPDVLQVRGQLLMFLKTGVYVVTSAV